MLSYDRSRKVILYENFVKRNSEVQKFVVEFELIEVLRAMKKFWIKSNRV